MEVQVWAHESITQMAGVLQVGYAFGAGMVSAVNPCGFAMLPVYLSLYLGAGDKRFEQHSWLFRLGKAVGITAVVTSGFGVLFGVIGIIVSAGGSFFPAMLPWGSVVVGFLLILLGLWMLCGKHLFVGFALDIGNRIGDPRMISCKGFFLFGLAFGVTSLGCTLPIFLVVVGNSLTSGAFLYGILQFVWFVLGMGTVLLSLTIGIAFVKTGAVVRCIRRMTGYVQAVSALLLIIAGSYICYYWLTSQALIY